MFKRILTYFFALLIGAALLVACGGAQAQAIPPAVAQPLDNSVNFGFTVINVATARSADIISGNIIFTEANGNTKSGYFQNIYAFYNGSAFKAYVRTTYNGGYRFWNTAAMSEVACTSNQTVVTWNGGQVAQYPDGCSLHTLILQFSRNS